MPSAATLARLLTSLERGETLLLPNPRAARELRTAFDARQRTLGLPAWEPAPALAWSQWTNSLYSELIVSGVETRLLLNAAQEHSLWRGIVADDPPADGLGSADALAELAGSAFRLAAAWNATARIRGAAAAPFGNTDTRTYARWAEEFARRCHTQRLLSPSLLEAALTQHLTAKAVPAPQTLQLTGFLSLTPAQESLLTALAAQGTEILHHTLAAEDGPTLHAAVRLKTPAEELHFAARWLRHTLETAQQAGQNPRIAVLLPGVAEERAEFDAVLRETLAPELQQVSEDLSSTPWEFSAGVPLSTLGLIADALEIARWIASPLPQNRVTALLLSPYLNSGAAREQAARIDALVRRKEDLLRPEMSLGNVVSLLDKHGSTLLWPRHLATEVARSGDLTKTRTYAEWMDLLRVQIQASGWPNSEARELTAAEFEATRAWDGVLDLVSTLDFSGRRVTFATALEALERQARSTPFAPPATHAPVQIMAPTEAEGSLFDAVLFLRATDEDWPAPERPHPLLPWHLQKELAMPGTDPVRSAARTKEFTEALLAGSRTVLFSSARADSDGQLRPSPLLAELGLDSLDSAIMDSAIAAPAQTLYETVPDDIPLPQLASNEVQGGARVLQLQAACGFRAFAEFRLHANEIERGELGFDAPESGRRLHEALQLFWKQVRTQAALRAMPIEERDRILSDCIERSVSRHVRPQSAWDEAFVTLQKQRMLSLLQQWMTAELQRGPFTVLDIEQRQQINLGPLSLEVRLDRIDSVETSDGSGFVLVDYKTGSSGHPNQWMDERGRPDDPQLPLYSLLDSDGQLKGLAFAKVAAGGMKWLGYQAEAGIFPKSSVNQVVDLKALVVDWHETLENLACAFAGGQAAVDPKDYPNTCERCTQRLLCRVDPATLSLSLPTGEEEGFDG